MELRSQPQEEGEVGCLGGALCLRGWMNSVSLAEETPAALLPTGFRPQAFPPDPVVGCRGHFPSSVSWWGPIAGPPSVL